MPEDSTPWLPRDEWVYHEHYPQQTLLLGSHVTFRRYSAHMLDRLRDIEELPDLSMKRRGRLLAKLGLLFGDWMSAMRSHERYEESRLYPLLSGVYGVDLSHLEAHHRALHDDEARVRTEVARAVDAAAAPEADPGWPALERALVRHRDALADHLRREESVVIPLLLELSPARFAKL